MVWLSASGSSAAWCLPALVVTAPSKAPPTRLRALLLSCTLHVLAVAALLPTFTGDAAMRRAPRATVQPSRMEIESPPPVPPAPVVVEPACEIEPVEEAVLVSPELPLEDVPLPPPPLVDALAPLPERQALRGNARVVARRERPPEHAPPAPPEPPVPATAPASLSRPEVPAPLSGHNLPPSYPEAARRRRIEGTVVVRIEVDAGGAAVVCAVVSSSGSELLDAAALAAARRWRFANGPGVLEQPFRFALTSD